MKDKAQNQIMKDYTVVIPTLEPTVLLIDYINDLVLENFMHIVIINDGSNEQYDEIFKSLHQIQKCTVITHDKNQGKGLALKTGYKFVQQFLPECKGIITADSDGQHAIKDVCKVAQELASGKECLFLGCRNFSLPSIPLKSKLGNRCSSLLFSLLYDKWIGDTQTGLRGFDIALLDQMLEINGERFEYEMEVIIYCVMNKITINQVEIETIYENNNSSTHFQTINDSLRIARVIFKSFIKFFSSSIISAILDLTVAWFLLDLLRNSFQKNDLIRIAIATLMARIISMLVNYCLNKKLVFKEKNMQNNSFGKYLSLCFIMIILSTLFVYIGHHFLNLNDKIMKILVDSILFILSYKVQQNWVFCKKNKGCA